MSKNHAVSDAVMTLLQEKAANSPCTYRISAVAFDKKGEILGHVTNSHSKNWNVLEKCGVGRAGTSEHAERRLLQRYRDLVKTIVICRIGRSGEIRPINPCKACLKVASKYGAKIVSVMPDSEQHQDAK